MGLQIVVDRDRCEGLGMCEAMASDYFEVREDADGEESVHVLDETPPESDRAHVHPGPLPRDRSLDSGP